MLVGRQGFDSKSKLGKYIFITARVENPSRSCWTARLGRCEFDAIPKALELADHFGGTPLCPDAADCRTTFLIADALVQNDPDQRTQPMGNSPDGLRMPEPWDEPPIDRIKDAPFGFHGGVRCLIEIGRASC